MNYSKDAPEFVVSPKDVFSY